MTSSEIRNSFLKFFEERAHTIVPSAPVVPYDDPTLLFANAGMNQFKDVFLGTGKRSYTRAADTQKCIRVSGKHNDLEEVGRDTYHHTFFEMLGNWSFGDYYKKEAIEWAWELLTKVWRLPKNRLWATVYKDDQEAEQLWKSVTDIDPKHILRFSEKDNFWEMGETGPCGPCSEIHIDRTPEGTATASMVNAGIADVMEIWNLVFIQYNRDETGKLTPLPAKHVDTGMGFERVCAVLQGKNSNYDTDVFTPIINKIAELTKQPYNGSLQSSIGNRPDKKSRDAQNAQSEIDTSMRVITDHVRTLTFAIGDGAIPSNEGRGYVLRRILRRAARFGRNLGMHEPFIYQLVPTLVETMSYIFPEIKTNQDHIQRVIKGEEESFNATLDKGLRIFHLYTLTTLQNYLKATNYSYEVINLPQGDVSLKISKATAESLKRMESLRQKQIPIPPEDLEWELIGEFKFSDWSRELTRRLFNNPPQLSGATAFLLYDTYGFPLDLTELMTSEYGMKVDVDVFNKLMEEQKERSKPKRSIHLGSYGHDADIWASQAKGPDFIYDVPWVETKIEFETTELLPSEEEKQFKGVILQQTNFYSESGGQVSDLGDIAIEFPDGKKEIVKVKEVKKRHDRTIHIINWHDAIPREAKIKTLIDQTRRLSIARNHSATHLLHNALRRILGTHVQQAGSLVAPDYFRFDFSHFAKLSEQELTNIEALVNEKIKENIPRTPGLNNIPFEDAKKMGAFMFFGDKYGERVNVIQFGDFSTEFCGGTHVNNTGEIGYFKIRSEGSVASGVRRIEGVTHNYALELLKFQEKSYFDRLDYAYEHLDEISNLKSELASISNGKSDFIHESFGGFEQRLEDLKHITPIPDHVSIELVSCFEQLSNRNQVLEEFLMNLADEKKLFEKELARFRLKSLSGSMDELISSAVSVDNFKLIAVKVSAASMDELKSFGDSLRTKLGSGVGVLASIIEDKVQLVCVVTDDLVAAKKIEAGKVVGAVAKIVGGGGGGRPHMATAGGKDIAKIEEALSHTKSIVESLLKK